MNETVALCLDEQSCCNPELIGLEGELLDRQDWLAVYNDAAKMRNALGKERVIEEAWVVSCDGVDPINLAATLKGDRPELRVCLVSFDGCGSLFSRAHTAHIDEVYDIAAFVRRYVEMKQRALDEASNSTTDQASLSESRSVDGDDRAKLAPPVLSTDSRRPQSGDARQMWTRSGRKPTHMRPEQGLISGSEARYRKGFLLTIVSGGGDAGKSSIAAVAALGASRRGMRTLLLDYDLQFGDVAAMVGAKNALAVDVALASPEKLQRYLEQSRPLTVLSAPLYLEAAEGVIESVPALLERVMGDFDVVIANTGAAWGEQHAVLLERSSAALFVIDQRSSSLRACRHALELCARCGIASEPFRFAINRCSKNAPFTSIDISCVLQGASVFELKDGGNDVEDCLSSGAVEELFAMNNDFARSVEQMLDRILPKEEGAGSMESEIKEGGWSLRRRGRHVGRKKARTIL